MWPQSGYVLTDGPPLTIGSAGLGKVPIVTALQVAVGAVVVAVLGWGLKALAIGLAGGLDRSPLESPLFAVGLVAIVVAFAAGGAAVAAGRSTVVRVVGGLAGVVLGGVVAVLVEGAVSAAVPDSAGWVKEEAGLWVSALLTLAVITGWLRHRRSSPGNEAPPAPG